jgi:VWFA-related protein
MRLRLFLTICFALALTAQKPYRFKTRVDLVSVPVAVTDKEGNFIKDLGPEEFTVYEDGTEQEIALFAAGLENSWLGLDPRLKEELSGEQVIGLILDASGSMEEEMKLVRSAALKFLDNIPRTQHLLVLDFDENIRLSEYSSDDQRQIGERIYDVEAEGWTALYDAVGTFVDRVLAYDGRKTLVVFSDGVDSRSALSVKECLDMVKASDVAIHSIQFGGATTHDASRLMVQGKFLRQIASLSGGSHLVARSLDQLDELFDRILEEMFSQYMLGYVSTNTELKGRYRKIKVKVNRKGVKVRAREGYLGPLTPEPADDGG